jgi:hypothetical protein
MFEQDDVENWASITQVSRGQMARSLRLNNRMGLAPEGGTLTEPIADWPAPGQAFVGFGEYGQRNLLTRWATMLDDERPTQVNGRRSTIGDPVVAVAEAVDGAAR